MRVLNLLGFDMPVSVIAFVLTDFLYYELKNEL